MEIRSFPVLLTLGKPGVNESPDWETPGEPAEVYKGIYHEDSELSGDHIEKLDRYSRTQDGSAMVLGPICGNDGAALLETAAQEEAKRVLKVKREDRTNSIPLKGNSHLSPDGATVYSSGKGYLLEAYDQQVRTKQQWAAPGGKPITDFAVSHDGSKLLLAQATVDAQGESTELAWFEPGTGRVQKLESGGELHVRRNLALAPDDHAVAYVGEDNHVYLRDLDGKEVRQLDVPDQEQEKISQWLVERSGVTFSPDGSRVLYATLTPAGEEAGVAWMSNLYAAPIEGGTVHHVLGGDSKDFVHSAYPCSAPMPSP